MKSIISDNSIMKSHYEIVVIGTGYGGGVSASRLARAGRQVCVLERGKEFLSEDFPDDLSSAKKEIQMDVPFGKGHLGSKLGLWDFKVNDQINALVGCGLGGTSLINANVALKLDAKVFSEHNWPAPFKMPKGSDKIPEFLEKYYDRASTVLGSNPYPDSYPNLNKVDALKKSADAMGVEFYKPPINVTFEDGPNAMGFEQKKCINCGDCCSGCKYEAKNTTQMNYLPDAVRNGAEIFCQALVKKLSKKGDKWAVSIEFVEGKDDKKIITADNVIVCAGTFGSTELLLRSKDSISLSKKLGSKFSGNGDVIAFGYNCYWKNIKTNWHDSSHTAPIYGIGKGTNDLKPEQMPGPCIAGVIDNRKTALFKDARVIEEGVFPGAFASLLPPLFFFADTQYGNFTEYGQDQTKQRLLDAKNLGNKVEAGDNLSALSFEGPLSRMQTYLVMSQDDAGGKMSLDDNDNIRVSWKDVGQSRAYVDSNAAIREANIAVEGQFIPNMMWTEPVGYQVITVHPLGGCCMAESAEEGVVNSHCQVFTGNDKELHNGLYVMDGSVIPGAAGVNPLLTITAISEFAIEKMAEQKGWQINYDPVSALATETNAKTSTNSSGFKKSKLKSFYKKLLKFLMFIPNKIWKLLKRVLYTIKDIVIGIAVWLLDKLIALYPNYFSPNFSFKETMHGFASENYARDTLPPNLRISNDYANACQLGEAENKSMSYRLKISAKNLNEFTEKHHAKATGWLTYNGQKYDVTDGDFILFDPDQKCVETWTMIYQLQLQQDGKPYYLHGEKYLHHTEESHWWNDVTTLYVDLYEGDSAKGRPIAKGIITLNSHDAIQQGNTLRMKLPNRRLLNKLLEWFPSVATLIEQKFLAKFAGFCAQTVFKGYGGLLADMENFPRQENDIASTRILDLPEPEIKVIKLSDGAKIKLYRYHNPGEGLRKQVVLAPGFSVTANSFATGTVDHNLVEYLYHGGIPGEDNSTAYDVWLFAYRASPDSENKLTNYTIDDIANKDWPAAITYIRLVSGADKVDAVAHCFGSLTLLMSLLIDLKGIGNVVSSQTTLHPVTNWLNFLKSDIGMVEMVEKGLPSLSSIKKKIPLIPVKNNKTSQELDVLCWQVPVPPGEQCNNPVCKRVFSIFGPSYTHSQLNHRTHIAIEDWFDEIATKPFEQIELICEKEYVVNACGKDTYLPNIHKLKDVSIHFIAGAKNQIFLPETSLRTFRWLKAHNPKGKYYRKVFSEYAHMDCFIGKNAYKTIFPYIHKALEKD